VPTENQVYADVQANVGWVPGGLAPGRPNWDGLLPVPGHWVRALTKARRKQWNDRDRTRQEADYERIKQFHAQDKARA
jgi:hypothetical protein